MIDRLLQLLSFLTLPGYKSAEENQKLKTEYLQDRQTLPISDDPMVCSALNAIEESMMITSFYHASVDHTNSVMQSIASARREGVRDETIRAILFDIHLRYSDAEDQSMVEWALEMSDLLSRDKIRSTSKEEV